MSKICDRVGIVKNGELIKVEKIENLFKKNLLFVTITSNQVKKIVKDLKLSILLKTENTIKFTSSLEADELIKRLANYKLDKILIEEAAIEEMFLHYYE